MMKYKCDNCGIEYDIMNLDFCEDGLFLCTQCRKVLGFLKQCTICGKWGIPDNFHKAKFINENGETEERGICIFCYNSGVAIYCPTCNSLWIKEDLYRVHFWNSSMREIMCPECEKKTTKPHCYGKLYEKDPIARYGYGKPEELEESIGDYDDIDWHLGMRVGIEIELEYGGQGNIFAANRILEAFNGIAICEQDTSLTDGLEFITKPLTLRQIMERKEDIKNALWIAKMFDFQAAETCGFHVHISREPFYSQSMLEYFLYKFFYKFKDELVKLSGRRESEFAKFPKSEEPEKENRYKAVNLISNNPTIEFRMWRGMDNVDDIMAAIQFCVCVMKYALNTNCNLKELDKYDSLFEIAYKLNVWSYKELTEYLEHTMKWNSPIKRKEDIIVKKEDGIVSFGDIFKESCGRR